MNVRKKGKEKRKRRRNTDMERPRKIEGGEEWEKKV